jgi:hypothetical protein
MVSYLSDAVAPSGALVHAASTSQADRGCAFWEREPGADIETDQLRSSQN